MSKVQQATHRPSRAVLSVVWVVVEHVERNTLAAYAIAMARRS